MERSLLLQATVLLPLSSLAVSVGTLKSWMALLNQMDTVLGPKPGVERGLPQAKLTAQMVDLAARRSLVRANCLSRSVALWWLLKRQNMDSNLRIGVRKEGEQLEAHAWVESFGRVVNDDPDVSETFAPFPLAVFPVAIAPPREIQSK